MPPNDTTPRGDEMVRRLPERKFPEPKPQGEREDGEMGRTPLENERPASREERPAPDMSGRPALPDHPVQMPADTEGGQEGERDEDGSKIVPVELPGRPGAPERVR